MISINECHEGSIIGSMLAALVNRVFINLIANMAVGARRINMGIFFLLIVNYPHFFFLYQYHEVSQMPSHSATPKNHDEP